MIEAIPASSGDPDDQHGGRCCDSDDRPRYVHRLRSGRTDGRRRPSGRPPPVSRPVQVTGVVWLTVTVTLVASAVVVFTGDLRPVAVDVTVVDNTVVRWLADLDVPGLSRVATAFAALSSWTAITLLVWGQLVALLIVKRLRHLLVVLVAWTVQGVLIQYVLGPLLRRPRPFGVELRTDWFAWALPSEQMAALTVGMMGILYALGAGRTLPADRQVGGGAVLGVVAIARMHLGVETPIDIAVGVAIAVTVSLLGFRLFTPNESFPVRYGGGRAAHLDVGGARGEAIRQALEEQLGLSVAAIEPFGLAGSAGSTPLRIELRGDDPKWLFAKLYARSHLRADRWYKLGRELLYGRLEDERPFHTVRRLVQQEDYALLKLHVAGLPSPRPYGFVELAPEREYVLVTEFFEDSTELGDADVDDAGHRRRTGPHPQTVGHRHRSPRHQAGQSPRPRRPGVADRRGVRRGPPQSVEAGRRPRQHDAVPRLAL